MSLREYEMVVKSVADPTRVRILKLLEEGEMCVCQIVAILELSQSTISKHLFLLKMASLKGWLNDDPVIVRDRKREALAREIGPVEICERGMTLPARRAASCCPAPRKATAGSRSLRGGAHGGEA
jgi:ArsR family transcriptional regulator, arsenate/arsenite/antimonite-responsive transcriptional repressor